MNKRFLLIAVSSLMLIGCAKPNGGASSSVSSEEPVSSSESVVSSSEISSSESSTSSSSSSEEVPPFFDYDGYYENLSWDNSEDLISKLHSIISQNYEHLRYDGNWATNQGADQSLYDFECVDLLYSFDADLKTNTYANGKGWQREHAFAASLMTGFTSGDAVGVNQGRATDFHNLFAANYSGNTSRGNKNFGVANKQDETYQDFGAYTFDSKNFEPADKDKGKVSRAIFYMAVMYNQTEEETVKVTLNYNDADKATYGKASTTVSIPVTYQPLRVVEDYVSYSKFTYTNWYYWDTYADSEKRPAGMDDAMYEALCEAVVDYGEGAEGYAAYSMANCQFAIGNLSTLIDWSGNYNVDYLEMQHNTFVYSKSGQGNRNPFVDYPELVDYAFGDKKNQAGSLEDLTPTYEALEMDKDEIHHYAVENAKREFDEGSTFTHDDYSVVAVKKDLSTSVTSYEDLTDEYTFTSADAQSGKKRLLIITPINNIYINVTVLAGSIDSCSYKGLVIDAGKGNFSNNNTTTVNGVEWLVKWTGINGKMGNRDATYGLAFGVASGGQTMGELIFETTQTVTINKAYFKGSCKSGETIRVTIYVNGEMVSRESISRTTGDTAPAVVGSVFDTCTGKVKIVIDGSGATNGAIYVHTLAFNKVN